MPVISFVREKPYHYPSRHLNYRQASELPKGAKALRKECLRLQRDARIAWEAAADAKWVHEVDRRRTGERMDKMVRAQEAMREAFSALRDEVKNLTQLLKK